MVGSFLPKYIVSARIKVDGPVEKPDVIGAIFGQTEGLFPDMNLRELQEKGRVGRIDVEIEQREGGVQGTIKIPTNLDRTATALLSAMLESIERVGPYACKVTIDTIVDVRREKRKVIVERAKELLRAWTLRERGETDELIREVQKAVTSRLIEYGEERLPAGAGVETSPSIIVVEGRADVLHLLKLGYTNAIAMEGAHVPETIVKLSKEREVTAFLDGDRSGDLLLKELLSKASIDFVARAPRSREVESLTAKEVASALRERVPASEVLKAHEAERPLIPQAVTDLIPGLRGTLEAVLLDEGGREIARLPVSQLVEKLGESEGVRTIAFDGIITQRLVDVAAKQGVELVVGERLGEGVRDLGLRLLTFSQVLTRSSSQERV